MPEILKDQIVTVRKGAEVRSLHPKKGVYVLRRDQKVKVRLVLKSWDNDGIHHPAEIGWAGTGGYWCYAKQSDLV